MTLLTINIDRFQRGDQQVFEKVYAYYYKALLHFAISFVQHDLAEEVVSDALYSLWKNRVKIQSSAHLKSFLFIAVKHGCIDVLRTEKQGDYELIEDIDLYKEEPTILVRIIHTELLQLIEKQLQNLPPSQQLIFRMIFFEGKSTEEIMDETCMTAESIFVQKSKALARLRKKFKYNPLLGYLLIYFIHHHSN